MSLTNRVCVFFLAALGIILAVYSLVFYTVTREHLVYQFSSEMRGVLNSLIAAAEVEETEVKWQPLEHAIDVGVHDEFGEVQWIVLGDLARPKSILLLWLNRMQTSAWSRRTRGCSRTHWATGR